MLQTKENNMFTSFAKITLVLIVGMLSFPLFAIWESGVTDDKNKWYYVRSEVTPATDLFDPEFALNGRMVVACNEAKTLHVYMQFNGPLKLVDPIRLTDRDLYDIKLTFDDNSEEAAGVLYRKKATVMEFANDERWTKEFLKYFGVQVDLPWRKENTVSIFISLDGASDQINATLKNCGIEFEED